MHSFLFSARSIRRQNSRLDPISEWCEQLPACRSSDHACAFMDEKGSLVSVAVELFTPVLENGHHALLSWATPIVIWFFVFDIIR